MRMFIELDDKLYESREIADDGNCIKCDLKGSKYCADYCAGKNSEAHCRRIFPDSAMRYWKEVK